MNKLFGLIIVAMIFILTTNVYADERIHVVVSILPQEFLVERIGKDKVDVATMIPPGGNPHTYEPVPSQLTNLSKADMYFEVGSGMEFETQFMKKISSLNRDMEIVNTSEGIRFISMQEHDSEDGGHHHHHGGKDPHVWLSPKNAIIMVTNIRDALVAFDPVNASYYKENARELILDLSELADDIENTLSGLSKRTFLIFHPAWGYFAEDFDLIQVGVEYCGKDPTPQQLAKLIKQAQAMGVKVIFASPQFSQKSANAIASEIKGRVVLIDPLAGDYANNLIRAAQAISEGYK